MAWGNPCREAYTAGGEAALLSPDILNDGAFSVVLLGAAPAVPPWRGTAGPSGVFGAAQSHGMDCRETWENLHSPP